VEILEEEKKKKGIGNVFHEDLGKLKVTQIFKDVQTFRH
jgi:hypothetical protein